MIRFLQVIGLVIAGLLAVNAWAGWRAGVFPGAAAVFVEGIATAIIAAAWALGHLYQEETP